MARDTYKIGPGFQIPQGEAQRLGREMEKLEKRIGHPVTRVDIEQAARDPNSPFHHHFDWDVDTAAYKFRLVQAGYLIQALRVVLPEYDGMEVRALIPTGTEHEFMRTTIAIEKRPDIVRLWFDRLAEHARQVVEQQGQVQYLLTAPPEAKNFVASARTFVAAHEAAQRASKPRTAKA